MSERYLPIEDHGIIGDLFATALVGMDGTIDWCCLPEIDSPSVFAALLDQERGGRFRVTLDRVHERGQLYLEGTNVLETSLRGEAGRLRITDFMPPRMDRRGPEIHRLLFCDEGEVGVEIEWSPRFDYGRSPIRASQDGDHVTVEGAGESLTLTGLSAGEYEIVEPDGAFRLRGGFRLGAGERRSLVCRFGRMPAGRAAVATERKLRRTVRWWRGWAHECDPSGDCGFAGPFHERVVRSGLLLKLLTHAGTGAIAAAPTTSLPETIGGVRNWDYRFSWVRDSSLVAQSLFAVGHHLEARRFLEWVEEVSEASDEEGYDPQIVYGLHGERDLDEMELSHLSGYRDSRPVRIGNAAAEQFQLDIFGEVMGAAYELVRFGGHLPGWLCRFLSHVADRVCRCWREPDHGIWEVRTEPQHFVFSKVMAWVALDRALRIARRYRLPGRVGDWAREREAIRRAVLDHGVDRRRGTFVQAFGSTDLDASNLLLPILDFLPARDFRVQATINATMDELLEDGMVLRYRADDGLPGREGAFVLCTFWLADALAVSGRPREAREIFHSVAGHANHLGLLPEQVDPRNGRFLGNFPQAFSQSAFINSVLYLASAEGRRWPGPALMGSPEHRRE